MDNRYNVIYADPPWPECGGKYTPKRGTASQFSTMTEQQLLDLDVPGIVANPCALLLWTTPRHIPMALRVMTHWGFRFINVAFTWAKVWPSGKLFFGHGRYTHANAEFCLLGVFGTPVVASHRVQSLLIAPHQKVAARKPAEIRTRIEELFGDVPRIELFARQRVDGWDAYGNELEYSDVLL